MATPQTVIAHDYTLSKFRPLSHILCCDDFDRGSCGWMDIKPNHTQKDFRPLNSMIDKTRWGPSMLSTATYGYAGTHGSMHGIYSLKLQTRPISRRYEEPPIAGSLSSSVKRLSIHRPPGLWQMEMWYAYTPEQDRLGVGEKDIRAFGMFFDIQDNEHRYQPGLRYVNSVNGELRQQWQIMKPKKVTPREWGYDSDTEWVKWGLDSLWLGKRRPDGTTDGYEFVPDAQQQLCYNESDDKINWLYLRMLFDTKKREYVEFQSCEQTYDLRGTKIEITEPYARIRGLINPLIWIENDSQRRSFMYIDSVLISHE